MSLKRFSKGFYFGIKDREIEVSLGTSKNDRPTCRSLILIMLQMLKYFPLSPAKQSLYLVGIT